MATIYDVAKRAGVSPKTVSRVLNGDAPVKAETRNAVIKAMAFLEYVPSSAAKSMRSHKTGLVGLITGAISGAPDAAEQSGLPDILIVQGAQQRLREAGFTVLIADTGGNQSEVPELVRTFMEHRVEGLLYVSAYHREVAPIRGLGGRPLVLANCFDHSGTPCVLPDDEAGQYELTKGLIARGHRRIGFVTLAEKLVARGLRLQGYKRALSEADIPFEPDLVHTGSSSDRPNDYEFLQSGLDAMLDRTSPPTAICCGNDSMAIRVYAHLRNRGLRIPQDLSVAGYDDHVLISQNLTPPLTSVRLPYRRIGVTAADRLIETIAHKSAPEAQTHQLVSGPVAWRSSVERIKGMDSKT